MLVKSSIALYTGESTSYTKLCIVYTDKALFYSYLIVASCLVSLIKQVDFVVAFTSFMKQRYCLHIRKTCNLHLVEPHTVFLIPRQTRFHSLILFSCVYNILYFGSFPPVLSHQINLRDLCDMYKVIAVCSIQHQSHI